MIVQFLNLGEIKDSIDGRWTTEIGFGEPFNRVQEADKFREHLTSEFIKIGNNEWILSTRNATNEQITANGFEIHFLPEVHFTPFPLTFAYGADHWRLLILTAYAAQVDYVFQ